MPSARVGSRGGAARKWLDEQEQRERKNGRVITKVMVALPHELTDAQRADLVRSFCEKMTAGRGSWLAAIHRPSGDDERNHHAHIVLRDKDPDTGKVVVGLSNAKSVDLIRDEWEKSANSALEMAGESARIDQRSLRDQGIDRAPAGHEGAVARTVSANGKPCAKLDRIEAARRKERAKQEAKAARRDREAREAKEQARKRAEAAEQARQEQARQEAVRQAAEAREAAEVKPVEESSRARQARLLAQWSAARTKEDKEAKAVAEREATERQDRERATLAKSLSGAAGGRTEWPLTIAPIDTLFRRLHPKDREPFAGIAVSPDGRNVKLDFLSMASKMLSQTNRNELMKFVVKCLSEAAKMMIELGKSNYIKNKSPNIHQYVRKKDTDLDM